MKSKVHQTPDYCKFNELALNSNADSSKGGLSTNVSLDYMKTLEKKGHWTQATKLVLMDIYPPIAHNKSKGLIPCAHMLIYI